MRSLLAILLVLGAVLAPLPTDAAGPAPEPAPREVEEPRIRELYVPFGDLDVLLEGQTSQHMFLSREQYDDLRAKAKQTPPEDVPVSAIVLSADYTGELEEGRARLTGQLVVEVLAEGLHAVPLELSGVGVRSALLDGQPAALGRDPSGQVQLFVQGKGRHELVLSMTAPLQTTAAQQSLQMRLPTPAATRLRLSVPGDVDVKSGAAITSREVVDDGRLTRLELVPQRCDVSIVMSLNNRRLQEDRVVVAQSVLVSEITAAYERLHATASLRILHGAAETFAFSLPEGFEVSDVTSPLLAQWDVEQSDPASRLLQVRLREPTTDPVVMNILATRDRTAAGPWTMPQLVPQDVASHVAIVGMLVENRLLAEQIVTDRMVPINTADLTSILPQSLFEAEPGAPQVRAVAAFYAPQPAYELTAMVVEPPAKLRVTTNLVLSLDEKRQHVQGSFALVSEAEKVFSIDLLAPPGWLVTEAALGGDQTAEAGKLPLEQYGLDDERTRVHIRLPRGFAPAELVNVFFRAEGTPAGWLGDWESAAVTFPVFAVRGATLDQGAIAVAAIDDFVVRPSEFSGLVPLDDDEKAAYGLAGVPTDMAYRYDAQPYSAAFSVDRKDPWITARSYSFFRIGDDVLTVHYELVYDIQNARTDRLALRLPAGTPQALSVRGLGGANLKEYYGETEQDDRVWHMRLAEPMRGKIAVAVDFEQPLPTGAAEPRNLPLVRADGVAYESGFVAVEGDTELDVQVDTTARKVDVGELVDAEYEVGQTGQRVLGVYGFAGAPPKFAVDVTRHKTKELPTTIVQSAGLITQVAAGRRSLTQADYALRTKALFLEVELPKQAELWSALLDGKPCKPQTEKGQLLLSLGAGSTALRELQIVYAAPIGQLGFSGNVALSAPRLAVRADGDADSQAVPITQLTWTLRLPAGYEITRTGGTVFTDELPERVSPLAKVAGAVFYLLGGVQSPIMAAQEDARLQCTNSMRQLGQAVDASQSMSAPDGYYEHIEGEAGGEATDASGAFDTYAAPLAGKLPEATLSNYDATLDAPMDPKPSDRPAPTEEELPEVTSPVPPPVAPPAIVPSTPAQPTTPQPSAPDTNGRFPGEDLGGMHQRRKKYASVDLAKEDIEKHGAAARQAKFNQLLGVGSLKIELDQGTAADSAAQEVTFQSLGADPQLIATVINKRRLGLMGWGIGLLVALIGVLLTTSPARTKVKYVIAVAVVAALLPQLLFVARGAGEVCDMAFFAACLLVLYYLAVALLKGSYLAVAGLFARRRSRVAQATAVVAFAIAAAVAAQGDAAPPGAKDQGESKYIIQVVEPSGPVTIPDDAILVPYDPAKGVDATPDPDQKLLVPYEKYAELWNRAYPDKRLEPTPLPAKYALAGAKYDAELSGDEYLTVNGQIEIDLFTDEPVTIPLPLSGGVLARALIDDQPAHLKTAVAEPSAKPAAKQQKAGPDRSNSVIVLYVQGKGRKRLDITVRLRLSRDGGRQLAGGRLPFGPSAALTLTVPQAATEVKLAGVIDRTSYETQAAGEQIETSLAAGQPLAIEWQPKVSEGAVDRSLTVTSDSLLDIREDGLRLTWRLGLEFPGSERESFRIAVPAEYTVEQVTGDNVRGWEKSAEDEGSRIDVTLLKAVRGSETITVHLGWRKSLIGDESVSVAAPPIEVVGAVLHHGRLTLRRSPLLDVRETQLARLTRTDIPADVVARLVAADGAEENPLGMRNYKTYRFVATPFTLKMEVSLLPTSQWAEVQSVVKIADLETTLETQVILHPEARPVFRARVMVPDNLAIDRVTAPGTFEWSVVKHDGRRMLGIYLGAGQEQPFSIFVQGKLEQNEATTGTIPVPELEVPDVDRQEGDLEKNEATTVTIPVPELEVLDVDRQEGDVVFQVDPAFDAKFGKLPGCQDVLLDRVFDWLKPHQRTLAALALHYTTPNYSGTVLLTARKPDVRCVTVTNVLVTDEKIEETVLLEYSIEVAGLNQVTFLLPQRLQHARISAPQLRQQTIELVGDAEAEKADTDDAFVRVTLDLQNEVMGQFSVLVANDRLATGRGHTAPLPVVEGVKNVQRFVTLEYTGMNDPVVDDAPHVRRLARQLQQFRKLVEVLGGDVAEGYVVTGNDRALRFGFTIEVREAVETAGAHIGLAETQLAVDAAGAFHGRMVLKVDNTTEQFLQIVLPDRAQLWTAEVAGRTVKPTVVPGGQNPLEIRIPLRKTQQGDADYEVVLVYGGRMTLPGNLRMARFPLITTQNIRVDRSLVRLYVPEDRRWFAFGGAMQRAREGDDAAGYAGYLGTELKQIGMALQSDNPYLKARAVSNYRGLKIANDNLQQTFSPDIPNADLRKRIDLNNATIRELDQIVQDEESIVLGEENTFDNRGRLSGRWEGQKASRARNVVQDVGGNWSLAEQQQVPQQIEQQRLNQKWLEFNKLENPNNDVPQGQTARLNMPPTNQPTGQQMFGVGVNQEAGQTGRIVLPEQNWGNVPAQPQAAGVQSRGYGQTPYAQPPVGEDESQQGKDQISQAGEARQRVRRYQEKLQQQADVDELKQSIRDVQLDRDADFESVTELTDRVQTGRSVLSQARVDLQLEDLRRLEEQLTKEKASIENQLGMERAARRQALSALEGRAQQLREQLAQVETRSGAALSLGGQEAGSANGIDGLLGTGFPGSGTRPTTAPATVLPGGYASLTVDLEFAGTELVFKSPRQGDITIRSVRDSTLDRAWKIGQVLVGLLILLVLYRLVCFVGAERLTGRLAALLLLLGGILSLLSGVLPLAGLIAMVAAVVLLIRRWTRRRPRAAAAR